MSNTGSPYRYPYRYLGGLSAYPGDIPNDFSPRLRFGACQRRACRGKRTSCWENCKVQDQGMADGCTLNAAGENGNP
jgi:hypothetical protein